MEYAFQLTPHPNARYQASLQMLAAAELRCMLNAMEIEEKPECVVMGGAPFFRLSCRGLTQHELRLLALHSSLYLWTREEQGMLIPLDKPDVAYLPSELAELLKYKGKTNATFTAMLMNMARFAGKNALSTSPLTVLDPMCGKGTTLFCALSKGENAVGIEMDRKDLKEASDYFSRYLQYHKLKHEMKQSSRSLNRGGSVPETLYTVADTREHYQAGETRSLRLLLGDTRCAGELLKKTPCDLLAADLPYGVQHAPEGGRSAERPSRLDELLPAALRGWHDAVKPGCAVALSFNTYTVSKKNLALWAENAGFMPLMTSPYLELEHYVEQAVSRDLLVAVRA